MINNLMPKLMAFPFLIISLSFHEWAHGFAAYKLGDNTAKNMGRLTLNPLAHLDPIGTLALLIASFGWAKPVPINPFYFKNPKRGMAITAIAGPLSNLIMAFVGVVVYVVSMTFFYPLPYTAIYAMTYFIQINLVLMAFNLIPFPPLDGSKLVFSVLSDKAYFKLMQYERFGILALILLSYLGFFSNYIYNAVNSVLNVMVQFVFKIMMLLGV